MQPLRHGADGAMHARRLTGRCSKRHIHSGRVQAGQISDHRSRSEMAQEAGWMYRAAFQMTIEHSGAADPHTDVKAGDIRADRLLTRAAAHFGEGEYGRDRGSAQVTAAARLRVVVVEHVGSLCV